MNKSIKIVLITLMVAFITLLLWLVISLHNAKISEIWIEREFNERLNPNYNELTVQTRSHETAISEMSSKNESWNIETYFTNYFDLKRDVIFYPDKDLQDINFNNLSGNWMLYGIPQTADYEVGISVCNNWIFWCETTYYKNPVCLKLIYIPRYLDRKREQVMTWCEVVDISKNWRTNLYFSVKF